MSRTYRKVFTVKPRHKNAIPYKRSNNILFKGDFDGVEVTIERDNRRKAQY